MLSYRHMNTGDKVVGESTGRTRIEGKIIDRREQFGKVEYLVKGKAQTWISEQNLKPLS